MRLLGISGLAAVLCLSISLSAVAQTPLRTVTLPVSDAQLNGCVWQPKPMCKTRYPQYAFKELPSAIAKTISHHSKLLDDSEYPDDPADVVYFLLPPQGEVQPLLSWSDSVSTKLILITLYQGKVAGGLRVANNGPDEMVATTFTASADGLFSVYKQS